MHSVICHIAFNTIDALPPLRNELRMLSRRGVATVACVLPERTGAPAADLPHVRYRTVRIALRRITVRQTPALKLLRFIEYLLRAAGMLLFTRVDIIVAHDAASLIPAWAAARLARRRLVYNAHELWADAGEGTAPWPRLWRRIEAWLCRRVDAVVAPEENRARIYRDEYGARALPVVVRNCPMDRPFAASDRLRRMLAGRGANPDRIILYQGLIDPSRCLLELVGAMAAADTGGAALVIMGRGDPGYTDALARMIDGRGIGARVFMLPAVPYEEVHPITCAADIGVLLYRDDSRNNHFCAPNKLYEYMHAGLRLLASDLPGLRAVVDAHDLGACADPENPAALAAALERLCRGDRAEPPDARRARIMEIARARYRWEDEFEKLAALYEGLGSGE